MHTARWLIGLAAARAAFWNNKKKDTRVLPHVVNGLYDTSWHARNVSSWSDIRKLAPRDGWTAALVVAAARRAFVTPGAANELAATLARATRDARARDAANGSRLRWIGDAVEALAWPPPAEPVDARARGRWVDMVAASFGARLDELRAETRSAADDESDYAYELRVRLRLRR